MEKGLRGLFWLTPLLAIAACQGDSDRLSAEQFSRFYAEVAEAQRAAPDSAAAVDSAWAVAGRHGISAGDLALFRAEMGENPVDWVDVWEDVVVRLKE